MTNNQVNKMIERQISRARAELRQAAQCASYRKHARLSHIKQCFAQLIDAAKLVEWGAR